MMLTNPVLTIEATDYTGQATAAELVPDVPTQQTRTLKPSTVIVDTDSAQWVFNVTVVQGSELQETLLDATPGDLLDVVYQVEPGVGKRKATFSVGAVPTNWGGDRGQTLTSQVSLAVSGAITWGVSS